MAVCRGKEGVAAVIHVAPQPEPASFDGNVRRRGLAWLDRNNIPLNRSLQEGTVLEPYWRDCLDDLYSLYSGTCAYLAIFFERVTGAGSTDHFVAKSKRVDLAYEWANFRLACTRMNSRKACHDDILDPFEIETGWFRLELVSGRIFPDPGALPALRDTIQSTIDRLGLDDRDHREMRARHYQEYREGWYPSEFLCRRSPFVWAEAVRQNLL